jgi:hypothetical protein
MMSGVVNECSAAEDTWSGQFPVLSLVLTALRHKWRDPGAGSLPPAEYALLTACEFWLALSRDGLSAYLGKDPAPRLRYAIAGFSRLGARQVVGALRLAQQELEAGRHPLRVAAIVSALAAKLSQTRDPVEDLIKEVAGEVIATDTTHA